MEDYQANSLVSASYHLQEKTRRLTDYCFLKINKAEIVERPARRFKLSCIGCDLSIALGLKNPNKGEKMKDAQLRICKHLGMGMEAISRHIIYPTSSFPINERLGSFLLNHSFHPIVKGHLVVQPLSCSRSSDQIYDFDNKAVISLLELVRKTSKALNETLGPERIYVWSFNEQDASKPNWHLHIHVAPRSHFSKSRGPEWLYCKSKCPDKVKEPELDTIVSDIRKVLLTF